MDKFSEKSLTKFQMKLLFYKKKRGYTNEDIARLADLPVTTVSRIMSGGTKQPTISTLEKLAKAFNCKPDELLGTDEAEPYFFDPETAEIAEQVKNNSDLKLLLDSAKDLSPEELKTFLGMIDILKKK